MTIWIVCNGIDIKIWKYYTISCGTPMMKKTPQFFYQNKHHSFCLLVFAFSHISIICQVIMLLHFAHFESWLRAFMNFGATVTRDLNLQLELGVHCVRDSLSKHNQVLCDWTACKKIGTATATNADLIDCLLHSARIWTEAVSHYIWTNKVALVGKDLLSKL